MKNFISTDEGKLVEVHIIGAMGASYVVRPLNEEEVLFVAANRIVEKSDKEYVPGDSIIIRHQDGNRFACSRGVVVSKQHSTDNEGNPMELFKVKVGSRDFEVTGQDIVEGAEFLKEGEPLTKKEQRQDGVQEPENMIGDMDGDARDKLQDMIMKAVKNIQSDFRSNDSGYQEAKSKLDPEFNHYVDGHIKIKTGNIQGGDGHAIFLPVGKDKFLLKQIQFTQPDSTPFKQEDVKKGEFSNREITNRVSSHIKNGFKSFAAEKTKEQRTDSQNPVS